MNIKPLYDRLVVRRDAEKEVTDGGIYLPENAKEKPVSGTVVAVGEGYRQDDGKLIPLRVKLGETVLFGRYAGQEVHVGDEEYLVLRENDIFAVLTAASEPAAV